jgi:hypothetical protein
MASLTYSTKNELLFHIGHVVVRNGNIGVPLGLALRQLEIVVQQNTCNDQLDLRCSEEAARAGVPTVTKAHVLFGHSHKLILLPVLVSDRVFRLALAQPVKPVRIKLLVHVVSNLARLPRDRTSYGRIGIKLWVLNYGYVGDFNRYTGRNLRPVVEPDRLLHISLKTSCKIDRGD